MTINNPSIESHNNVHLLGSVDSVDFGTIAATTLYTVPVGKTLVIDHVRIRVVSGDLKLTQVKIGQSTDTDDFLGAQVLSGLSAAGKTGKLEIIPNATIVAGIEYTAGEAIVIDVTTASGDGAGTPTGTVELFGTLDNA